VRITMLLARLLFPAFTAAIASWTAQAADPTQAETEWVNTLAPHPEGGWKWLTWGPGVAVYVSYRNAQRDGAVATVWIRWEYLAVQQAYGASFKSSVQRTEFDCVRIASRLLSATLYSANSLAGEATSYVFTDKQPAAWQPDIPGTLGETVTTAVCKQTKPHAPKVKASS
jgi:hypothetical protein